MTKRLCVLLESSPLAALLDLLVVVACAWGAILFTSPAARPSRMLFVHLLPLLACCALLCFAVAGLYRLWSRRTLADLLSTLLLAQVLYATVWMALCGWEPQWAVARRVLLLATLLQWLALIALRTLLRALVRGARRCEAAVLVASDLHRAAALRLKFAGEASAWIEIDAILSAEDFLSLPPATVLWQTVLVEQRTRLKNEIVHRAASLGKSVLLVPDVAELWTVGAHLLSVDDQLLFRLSPPHLPPALRALKRLSDGASAVFLLVLTAPVLLAAALAVRLGSRGPVFYAQTRVGANGRLFTLYKLRTMIVNAEASTGPVLAERGDGRVTAVGRLLRATRLDELPQLANVLLGSMSLVGPRPERPHFVEQFSARIPGYELRHAVKPGLTGLAQVSGGYATSAEHKLRFDLVYIYNYSLWLDLEIVFRTLLTLLHPARAEGIEKIDVGSETAVAALAAECNNKEVTHV
jgi:exopolysaccharide biosynthesis polyprenyl glycosylphosphotransferase